MSFCICVALLVAGIEAGENSAAAKANNEFAVDLYKQLSVGDGNFFFSPLSISSALAMAHAGAAGNTADEMAKVLHLEGVVDAEFGALVKAMTPGRRIANTERLDVANALWLDNRFEILESYTKTVQEEFLGELSQVDFEQRAEDARLRINKWGWEKTAGRISDLIPQGQVNRLTRLVLTNAMYFQGKWSNEFSTKSTENKQFHVTPELDITAPMMNQKDDFPYLRGDGFQMVQLHYRGGAMMLIMLPDAVDGLKALEEKLTVEQIQKWLAPMPEKEVVLSLPKFKTSSESDLKDELAKLGMIEAFQETAADFSRMTKGREVHITAVIHKAWVDVDEEGTEAAALTAVDEAYYSLPEESPPPIFFNADHPFLYAICDRPTGAILFIGRMVNPSHEN